MKKVSTYILLLAISSATFVGCSSSKKTNKGILGGAGGDVTGQVVKTVATVVGVILLTKLIKAVMGSVTGSSAFASLAQDNNFTSKLTEATPISSFANSDIMKTALQVLVAQKYQIPLSTVTNNFNNIKTVGELATFVGQNASAKSLSGLK